MFLIPSLSFQTEENTPCIWNKMPYIYLLGKIRKAKETVVLSAPAPVIWFVTVEPSSKHMQKK
jgi:hypothetical protein